MPALRSAGIILFRNTKEGRTYLVLRAARSSPQIGKKQFAKEFWDFPKGELDPKETAIDAARREAKEEAGIHIREVLPDFRETVQYFVWRDGKPILKFVALFLAQSPTEKVTLSWEHDACEWLLFADAKKRLMLPQMKKALEAAEKFLNDTRRL